MKSAFNGAIRPLFSKFSSKLQSMGAAKGTLLFMLSTVVVKLIGALYKIPLLSALGAEGMGVYQLVFPLYAFFCTFAGQGIPSAHTKLAGSYSSEQLLKRSLQLFLPISLFLSCLLFFAGGFISRLQGGVDLGYLYKVIAPSVVLVCLIFCLRGYFQGCGSFTQTALSQVIEQAVKALIGILLVVFVGGNYYKKAALAIAAVTFSEVVALAYLTVKLINEKARARLARNIAPFDGDGEDSFAQGRDGNRGRIGFKALLSVVVPLSLTSVLLPLAGFTDSFFALSSLKQSVGESATALYGVYSGGVDTVIGLPSGVIVHFAIGFLPSLSRGKSSKRRVFLLSAILAAAAGLCVLIFARPAVNVLYGGLGEYKPLLIKLLRLGSVNVLLLSLLQVSNTLLLSMGKQYYSVFSMLFGIAVKIVVDITVLKISGVNIFGMIISDAGCYFVALALNLVYIYYISLKKSGTVKPLSGGLAAKG